MGEKKVGNRNGNGNDGCGHTSCWERENPEKNFVAKVKASGASVWRAKKTRSGEREKETKSDRIRKQGGGGKIKLGVKSFEASGGKEEEKG